MAEIEEKRLLVRALRARMGRGFAEECGFPVIGNPGRLFQILYLSVLLARDRDHQRALRAAQEMRDHGGDSAAGLARARQDEFGDLAQAVIDRWHGDLRRLRGEAQRDPGQERSLLTSLPGVNDRAVDLFFREVQVLWPEVAPFADQRTLAAARKLGLGRTVADLSALSGSRESEKFSWLAGALARVDLENRYDEIRAAARASVPGTARRSARTRNRA